MVAVDMLPLLEQQAKERMLAGKAPDPGEKVPQGNGRAPKATEHAAAVARWPVGVRHPPRLPPPGSCLWSSRRRDVHPCP